MKDVEQSGIALQKKKELVVYGRDDGGWPTTLLLRCVFSATESRYWRSWLSCTFNLMGTSCHYLIICGSHYPGTTRVDASVALRSLVSENDPCQNIVRG
jgi:hypothetical protein